MVFINQTFSLILFIVTVNIVWLIIKRIFSTVGGNYGTALAVTGTALYSIFTFPFFANGNSSSKLAMTVQTACTAIKSQQFQYVIDVRSGDEWRAGHLSDSVHIPLQNFNEGIQKFVPKRDTRLLIVCRSGRRAGMATEEAIGLGYTQVNYVGNGGVEELQACLK